MTAAILSRPTLVLNRLWQPVGVSTIARSLLKVWSGTARVVDPEDYRLYTWEDWAALAPRDDEPFLQTPRCRVRAPEVVTLSRYDRVPANAVTFSRRNVFKRDRFTCQYCHSQPGSAELTIDHVIPRSQGGATSWANCVLACIECNARKADRTPEEARMPLLRRPTRPTWKPLYASRGVRIDSWGRFLSEAYWSVELQNDD